MYRLGLLLGGFNPPHSGHFEVIKVALERTCRLHVLIGLKRKHQLSYEVRAGALQEGLEELCLNEKVIILPKGRFHDADLSPYDLFVIGSDVFNNCGRNNNQYGAEERRRFSSFPNLLVLEREGVPIDLSMLESVRLTKPVEVYDSRSPVCASFVREKYRKRESVHSFMPERTRNVVEPHAYLFSME